MTDPSASAYTKGVLGEQRALDYLCDKGMVPLCRRYHSPFGEIDLIMKDGETLVFVEVKARQRGRRHDGLNAVNPRKQARIFKRPGVIFSSIPPPRPCALTWSR